MSELLEKFALRPVQKHAVAARSGPEAKNDRNQKKHFSEEVKRVAPTTNPEGNNWIPGDAPSQALAWAVDSLAKAGTVSISVSIPKTSNRFPLGKR